MQRKIKICDETIWLGEQTPGYSMSTKEKVEIAKQLERLGVDIIEVGYVYPQTEEAIKEISETVKSCCVEVMCEDTARAIEKASKAVEKAQSRRINIVLFADKKSEKDVEKLIKTAKKSGSVELTINNACDIDEGLLLSVVTAAANSGADVICICDGSGSCAPTEFFKTVKMACDAVPNTAISAMCNNDLGMAVANTLSAVKAGASEVKCSVGGVGKRAGTAALEEVAAALFARGDYYEATTGVKTRNIYRTSKLVSTVLGYQIVPNRPIIGDNAFNSSGDDKKLILKPEVIGVFRNNLVLGKFSTRYDFEARVTELGYTLTAAQIDECYEKFVELTSRKKNVSDKDVEAIVEPLGSGIADSFELVNFVINSGNMIPSTATITMRQNGKETTKVEIGSGPIDAAFKAIDRISKIDVSLESFALQSVTEGEDALGDAVVKVKYIDKVVTGRGISTDVIEASVKAYINALNKIAATIEK